MRLYRSSPRLTLAAATLLAVLALPGDAGGESSASCLAQLNAVRQRVGSPPARARHQVAVRGHVRASPTAPWRPFWRSWPFTTA